jgi:hypothetical protein
MALSGLRSSWLMLERKSEGATPACSHRLMAGSSFSSGSEIS